MAPFDEADEVEREIFGGLDEEIEDEEGEELFGDNMERYEIFWYMFHAFCHEALKLLNYFRLIDLKFILNSRVKNAFSLCW